jgi:phosphatidylserine/phosphatidylglycerophosphate/cardiolipin synthase-like enzyme
MEKNLMHRKLFLIVFVLFIVACASGTLPATDTPFPTQIPSYASDTPAPFIVPSTDTPAPLIVPATDTPAPFNGPVTDTPVGASIPKWSEVYFTDPLTINDPAVIDGSIEGKLIEFINNAKVSIHIASFEFDLTPVAEALIAAKNRGVDVKWVTDDKNGGGCQTWSWTICPFNKSRHTSSG